MLFYTKPKVREIVLCRSDVFLWKMTMQVIEERRLETGIFGMKRIRKDIQRTKEGAETPLASVLLPFWCAQQCTSGFISIFRISLRSTCSGKSQSSHLQDRRCAAAPVRWR